MVKTINGEIQWIEFEKLQIAVARRIIHVINAMLEYLNDNTSTKKYILV